MFKNASTVSISIVLGLMAASAGMRAEAGESQQVYLGVSADDMKTECVLVKKTNEESGLTTLALTG